MLIKTSLVGIWKLCSFQLIFNNKEVVYPYGERAMGYIIYTEDNFMSVNIMKNDRKKCSTDNPRDISLVDKIEIADNYMGYSGKYDIKEETNTIIHYPEVSSFPNAAHNELKREYKFQQRKLILSADFESYGFYSKIIWKRL